MACTCPGGGGNGENIKGTRPLLGHHAPFRKSQRRGGGGGHFFVYNKSVSKVNKICLGQKNLFRSKTTVTKLIQIYVDDLASDGRELEKKTFEWLGSFVFLPVRNTKSKGRRQVLEARGWGFSGGEVLPSFFSFSKKIGGSTPLPLTYAYEECDFLVV